MVLLAVSVMHHNTWITILRVSVELRKIDFIRSQDYTDYYYGESWDDLSDELLESWIDRLFIHSADFLLPFEEQH